MIQTTKDADKAKTSQRQGVDDQNDRFVCHHALPRSLLLLFFSGFPDLLRDTQPGTAKGRVGSAGVRFTRGDQQTAFYTSQFRQKQCLWLMIGSRDKSQK